jgi:hypothetical protein
MGTILLVVILLILIIVKLVMNNFGLGTSKEFNKFYEVLKKYENADGDVKVRAYKINGVDDVIVALNDASGFLTIYYTKNGKLNEKVYNHEAMILLANNTEKDEYEYYVWELIDNDEIYTLLDDIVKEKESPTKYTNPTHLSLNWFAKMDGDVTTIYANQDNFKANLKDLIENAPLPGEQQSTVQSPLYDDNGQTTQEPVENKQTNEESKQSTSQGSITVAGHTLLLGTYTGTMQNMDGSYSDVIVVLKQNTIIVDGVETTYYVSGNFIFVCDFEMFQVESNNQMV